MKTKQLALCALFSAMLCVCAWLSIPFLDTPVTMQSFAVALALLVLGGKRGSIAIAVYLFMGAVGLPVFSGFRGGLGALLGPTGGFLWGFLSMGLVFWLFRKPLPGLLVGMAVCYICGTLWYAQCYAGTQSILWIAAKCILPYLLPDGIKLFLAFSLAPKLKKVLSPLP